VRAKISVRWDREALAPVGALELDLAQAIAKDR
jgi:hypothetical protein